MLLVVIGDRWLGASFKEGDKKGKRRLNDPTDFVRIELEAALRGNIRIIPVLVESASMPNGDELPETLEPLVYRNAAEVRSGRDLRNHLDRLIQGVEQAIEFRFADKTQSHQVQTFNFPKDYRVCGKANSLVKDHRRGLSAR